MEYTMLASLTILHPVIRVLLWILLVACLQIVQPTILVTVGSLLVLAALQSDKARFRTLIRRTRWIFLSLLLIYGYATPGEAVLSQLGQLSPSMEGLQQGGLQLARILFALAALVVLVLKMERNQLLEAVYALTSPLKPLGLSREKLAVRLALTLHYAETGLGLARESWRSDMERALENELEGGVESITLTSTAYHWIDGLILLLGVGTLSWLAWS